MKNGRGSRLRGPPQRQGRPRRLCRPDRAQRLLRAAPAQPVRDRGEEVVDTRYGLAFFRDQNELATIVAQYVS